MKLENIIASIGFGAVSVFLALIIGLFLNSNIVFPYIGNAYEWIDDIASVLGFGSGNGWIGFILLAPVFSVVRYIGFNVLSDFQYTFQVGVIKFFAKLLLLLICALYFCCLVWVSTNFFYTYFKLVPFDGGILRWL